MLSRSLEHYRISRVADWRRGRLRLACAAFMFTPSPARETLANGLRVVTVELPHLHTAVVSVYVRVGSRYESAADNGLSHFLEHMFYRGSAKYPSSYELNFAIEDVGGTLHAETSRDYSLYQVGLSPRHIDRGFEILADLLTTPRFDDIDLEREIILEELSEDYDEDGVEIASDEISRRVLFSDHPLGYRITGPRENVARFSVSDLRRHHERFYGAANMVLCVAGPVAHDQVMAGARRYFEALPPGTRSDATWTGATTGGPRLEYVADPGSQTNVHLAFHAVPESDPRYMAQLALLRVIDDGMSTRLHYRLCDQLGLAYSVGASIEPLHDAAVLDVDGATSHGKVPALVDNMLALLGEFRHSTVSAAELDKVKRRYRSDMEASLDDSLAMASWFGGTSLYLDPPALTDRVAAMDAVTADDVLDIARFILRPERMVAVVVGHLNAARRGEVRELITSWR